MEQHDHNDELEEPMLLESGLQTKYESVDELFG